MKISQPSKVVSETIGDGESVTVPNDETWLVTIAYDDRGGLELLYNGNKINANNQTTSERPRSMRVKLILKGGETIGFSNEGDYGGGHLYGYDISDNIENEVKNIFLSSSESVTVPSGECWKIYTSHTATTSSTGSSLLINNQVLCRLSDAHEGLASEYIVDEGDTIEMDGSASGLIMAMVIEK